MNQTLDNLAAQSRARPVWLRVGRLFTGDTLLADSDILFTAREILHVGPNPSAYLLPPNQSTPDLNLPDHTLLPTLIEAHAHLFLEGAPVDFAQREAYLKNTPEWMLQCARARLPKILQSGIAAIRDAGDKYHVGLTLSSECKSSCHPQTSNQQPATSNFLPHVDSPGPAIYHRGRYGSFMGQPIEDHASPAASVASRVADGADRIKLLVSGIINFKEGQVTTPPQMPIDEVKALVAAAKSHGKQTFAHASGAPGVENSIEGGVNTVEHGFFITEDQLKKMRDRSIAWVPTFAPVKLQIDRAADLGWSDEIVGHLKRIIDSHRQMLRIADEIGVPIVAGSDAGSCGVPHAVGFLDELLHMQTAGLSPLAVIRSATAASADILNFPHPIGRLAPGFLPRMILTPHNPFQTVANLQKSKTILFDGATIHSPAPLDPAGL